jgi:septum site-determining protein MinC
MLETTQEVPSEPRPSSGGKRQIAFDLKGTMAPLTVLRLRATDIVVIERQLRVKIAQLPHLFVDAPVLLDLGALGDEAAALPFADLVQVLKLCKLVPVAVSNVPEALRPAAVAAGLGVLQPQAVPRATERSAAEGQTAEPLETPTGLPAPAPREATSARKAARPAVHGGPMVIKQPVRSGQVIYAQNNDLVVLAPVNPGAQVIADGHVHIYAPLRGRAVAGAQGLLGARIFCQKLEAELVAISGAYVMADEIPEDRRGKPAQIFLDGGECRIGPL